MLSCHPEGICTFPPKLATQSTKISHVGLSGSKRVLAKASHHTQIVKALPHREPSQHDTCVLCLPPVGWKVFIFRTLCSHLRVDGVGDLLPPRDLLGGEDARSQGVALTVRRDLRGLRDDEAFKNRGQTRRSVVGASDKRQSPPVGLHCRVHGS